MLKETTTASTLQLRTLFLTGLLSGDVLVVEVVNSADRLEIKNSVSEVQTEDRSRTLDNLQMTSKQGQGRERSELAVEAEEESQVEEVKRRLHAGLESLDVWQHEASHSNS